MKNFFIFVVGFLTGTLLTIVVLALAAGSNSTNGNPTKGKFINDGVTLFEEEGECISTKAFEVFQVLDSGEALAHEVEQHYGRWISTDLLVLLLNEDGASYYDNQVIKIPSGKCAKQLGTYKYTTQLGKKTVPIVAIRDK